MKPKEPYPIERLMPEVMKQKLPVVEPLPVDRFHEEPNLLKALPYYLLTYGSNIEKIGAVIDDKRLAFLFIGIGKLLKWTAKYYKH